ncbi:MAG: AbrB/MazE/SpoVT family DNA-binding domain-containing protein [Candidatus Altiarchaeota archaeon]|nr:AbrB/MazE/SpoVT family DNA-binding domain-containing protein [Candidatus Altiarchaeota archaeon]
MNIELTKISQKGQVVIPQQIRKKLGIKKGTRFAVFGEDDTVILKKVDMPTTEEFKKLTQKTARKDITDEDIEDAIRETRSKR